MYRQLLKPLADSLVALIAILILMPFFLVIGIILSFANHGKILFRQKRVGKDEKSFVILKFKTMNDKCDANGMLLTGHQRLTRIGRFLRNYSLDEIPQLFNILKGEMSFVGPRPLHLKYLPLYNFHQRRRHLVRGGLTGWAQVNGRNTISWEEKFDYDVWYVDHYSFFVDLRILWLTFIKVIRKNDIDHSRELTMPPFTGSQS